MEELFIKIYETFATDANKGLFTSEGLTPPKYIDLYRGQPIAPERFELFHLPAIFIEYSIDWQQMKGSGLLTLNVHVMLDANHKTNSNNTNNTKGLLILRYYRLVNLILRNTESNYTGKLQLISEKPVEADVVNYHILTYQSSITDEFINPVLVEGEIEKVEFEKGELKYLL